MVWYFACVSFTSRAMHRLWRRGSTLCVLLALPGITLLWAPPASVQERVLPDPEQAAAALEQRYANALPADQFQRLGLADGSTMPALFIEQTTSRPQGGLLILHDSGQHPDWPRLVHELRVHLPDTGWSTLAITLPAPPRATVPARTRGVDEPGTAAAAPAEDSAEAHYRTLRARMTAGISELTGRGFLNIAVIGIGSSAGPAARFVQEDLNAGDVDNIGLILIDTPFTQSPQVADILENMDIRLLDIYGHGEQAARAAAVRRAASQRNDNRQVTQVRAQRWLTPNRSGPQPVIRRTWGWLRSNMAGAERDVDFVDAQ